MKTCLATDCACNQEGFCAAKQLFGVSACKKNYTNKDLVEVSQDTLDDLRGGL